MNAAVVSILKHYPQMYLACHVDHVRKRSNAHALSDRDSSILAHLSHDERITAAALARHIGVRPSTLSAALKRLEMLGYVARELDSSDRRVHRLRLTARGAVAMVATSVLDPARVTALLERLDPRERTRAVQGLALLARAARTLSDELKEKRP